MNNTDPTGKFCESISTCAAHRETIDRAQGKISPEQVRANETARGFSTLIGTGIVVATVAVVTNAPAIGAALSDGLGPLAQGVAAEANAARVVGNATASAIHSAPGKVATKAQEIAQTASQAVSGPAAAGAMEALATTSIGAAERAGIQHAAEIALQTGRASAIQTMRTQTTEEALSAWLKIVKNVDKAF